MTVLNLPETTYPLMAKDSQAPEEYCQEVAECKRFLEWWSADPDFREQLPKDPYGVTRAAGLVADPEALRPLWDLDYRGDQPLARSLQRYRAFMKEKLAYRTLLRDAARSHHERFDAWRLRQLQRCTDEMGPTRADALVHSCTAVELCQGCSVGCWFCGISALKLTGVVPYDEENQQLWQGILEVLGRVVGEGAARGFCYWATDPLDNPDYERFCQDFHRILGRFPQTTSAQPVKNPGRVRELLKLSRQSGCQVDRFSILTRGILKKVFAEYSARELLHVELVMQMDGAWGSKAFAGRAREKVERFEKSTGKPAPEPDQTSTIACVSGFLIRMPERSVELITPCHADDRWPMGYRIYGRRTFQNVQEFQAGIEDLLSGLSTTLPLDQPVRLRRDLVLTMLENGFELKNAYVRHEFREPVLRSLGEALAAGDRSPVQIALDLEARHGKPLPESLLLLNGLYARGLVDDEPS